MKCVRVRIFQLNAQRILFQCLVLNVYVYGLISLLVLMYWSSSEVILEISLSLKRLSTCFAIIKNNVITAI